MKKFSLFLGFAMLLTLFSCKKDKEKDFGEISGIYHKDLSADDIKDKKQDDITAIAVGDSLFIIERTYTKIAAYKDVAKKLVDGTKLDDVLEFFGLGVDDASQWEHTITANWRIEQVSNHLYRGILTETFHEGHVQGASGLGKSFKLNEFTVIFSTKENEDGTVPIRWDDQSFNYFKE